MLKERAECNHCGRRFHFDPAAARIKLPAAAEAAAGEGALQQRVRALEASLRHIERVLATPAGAAPSAVPPRAAPLPPPPAFHAAQADSQAELRQELADAYAWLEQSRGRIQDLADRAAQADRLQNEVEANRSEIEQLRAQLLQANREPAKAGPSDGVLEPAPPAAAAELLEQQARLAKDLRTAQEEAAQLRAEAQRLEATIEQLRRQLAEAKRALAEATRDRPQGEMSA
jgi:hypothetical protein